MLNLTAWLVSCLTGPGGVQMGRRKTDWSVSYLRLLTGREGPLNTRIILNNLCRAGQCQCQCQCQYIHSTDWASPAPHTSHLTSSPQPYLLSSLLYREYNGQIETGIAKKIFGCRINLFFMGKMIFIVWIISLTAHWSLHCNEDYF